MNAPVVLRELPGSLGADACDGASRPLVAALPWTVVATHPQAERWAEQNIARAGYRTYLPMVAVRKRDRVVRTVFHSVLVPLFPGYLFVVVERGSPWTPVRYAPGVRSLLVGGNGLQYCRAGDCEALQAGERDRRTPPTRQDAAWRVGQACRLGAGVFSGVEGVIVELRPGLAKVALIAAGSLSHMVVQQELLELR